MVIPFSLTFNSPALHKYPSASSLSKSPKLLILQFLVKCYKLHSVFKVLSKLHMSDILISSVSYKCSYKLWFHSLKEFKQPFYTSIELTCGTLIIKKNQLNLCMLISFKVFCLCIKWVILWYLDNRLRKKLNLCMLLQASKNILCKNQIRMKNMYLKSKYEQLYISAKRAVIKLLKFQQLITYESLLSCQRQCIKFKPNVKNLFLE